MALDKYSQLKIAANVLDTTIQGFADELDVTSQSIRMVADGKITSSKISEFIDQKIKEADKIYQEHRNSKIQTETA